MVVEQQNTAPENAESDRIVTESTNALLNEDDKKFVEDIFSTTYKELLDIDKKQNMIMNVLKDELISNEYSDQEEGIINQILNDEKMKNEIKKSDANENSIKAQYEKILTTKLSDKKLRKNIINNQKEYSNFTLKLKDILITEGKSYYNKSRTKFRDDSQERFVDVLKIEKENRTAKVYLKIIDSVKICEDTDFFYKYLLKEKVAKQDKNPQDFTINDIKIDELEWEKMKKDYSLIVDINNAGITDLTYTIDWNNFTDFIRTWDKVQKILINNDNDYINASLINEIRKIANYMLKSNNTNDINRSISYFETIKAKNYNYFYDINNNIAIAGKIMEIYDDNVYWMFEFNKLMLEKKTYDNFKNENQDNQKFDFSIFKSKFETASSLINIININGNYQASALNNTFTEIQKAIGDINDINTNTNKWKKPGEEPVPEPRDWDIYILEEKKNDEDNKNMSNNMNALNNANNTNNKYKITIKWDNVLLQSYDTNTTITMPKEDFMKDKRRTKYTPDRFDYKRIISTTDINQLPNKKDPRSGLDILMDTKKAIFVDINKILSPYMGEVKETTYPPTGWRTLDVLSAPDIMKLTDYFDYLLLLHNKTIKWYNPMIEGWKTELNRLKNNIENKNSDVTFHPNPINKWWNLDIKTPITDENISVEIYNLQWKKIYQQSNIPRDERTFDKDTRKIKIPDIAVWTYIIMISKNNEIINPENDRKLVVV